MPCTEFGRGRGVDVSARDIAYRYRSANTVIILRRRIYFPEYFPRIIGPKTGPRPYLSIKFIFRIYRIYLIFRNIFFRIIGPKTGPGPYLSNIFIFRIYRIYLIFRIIYRIYLIRYDLYPILNVNLARVAEKKRIEYIYYNQ